MSGRQKALARQPAPRAVAQLARGFLDEAAEARQRARRGGDAEALHDERVALRRLRSTLRAYREVVAPQVPRRLERRLARLARASNAARDAQVQLAWLEGVPEADSPAGRRLAERLAALARGAEAPAKGFAGVRRRLGKRLRHLARRGGEPFGRCAAARMEVEREAVLAGLAAVCSVEDSEAIHRARIAVKRLRYLITPFAAAGLACAEAVAELRRLQDLLGELHDRHLFPAQLRPLLAALGAEQGERLAGPLLAGEEVAAAAWAPPEAAQLAALAARGRADAAALFARLEAEFLVRLDAFGRRLTAAVAEVRDSAGGRGG